MSVAGTGASGPPRREAWRTAIEPGRLGVSLGNRGDHRARYFRECQTARRDFAEVCQTEFCRGVLPPMLICRHFLPLISGYPLF